VISFSNFWFPRSSPLLLVIFLAQQFVLPHLESLGTGTASGGVLASVACCVSLCLWQWHGMKEESVGVHQGCIYEEKVVI
jgi:hypothetical protein